MSAAVQPRNRDYGRKRRLWLAARAAAAHKPEPKVTDAALMAAVNIRARQRQLVAAASGRQLEASFWLLVQLEIETGVGFGSTS